MPLLLIERVFISPKVLIMKQYCTLLIAALLFLLNACVVPTASESNSIEAKGKVEQITEGSSYDVVIKIAGDDKYYYINRGLENGLTMQGLQEKILNKEILMKYADMTFDIGAYHVYEVRIGEEIIYTEMADKS